LPLHEYTCGRCGRFEVLQKLSDLPLGVCPTCGEAVQRLISAPAIQFKGSGWYVTDYGRQSSAESKKEAAAGADSSTKDSATSSPKSTTSTESSAAGSSPAH
jgi:putative FmdB family regulatory protein